jgi:hypothetical protein
MTGNCLHPQGESCVFCQRAAIVPGVGPDAPIQENENGYRSSRTPYRMDLMPGKALLHMANIMSEGAASHGENNWKNGTVNEHLNKMLVHVFAHLAGDTSDDHIGHAAWRAMAALEIYLP